LLLTDVVTRAAKQARGNPAMTAWAFAQYQRWHRLNTADLASWLGLPPPQLWSLALCRRPDPRVSSFSTDVHVLATASGCDVTRLTELLREAA
jgi:hypothetical protein